MPISRTARVAVAAAALSCLSGLAVAAPATAQSVSLVYTFDTLAFDNGCIDAGGAPGANPYSWDCADRPNIQFISGGTRDGATLKNLATGECLVDNGGSDVILTGCNPALPNHQWAQVIPPNRDSDVQLRNLGTGLCMDAGGAVGVPVYTTTCDPNNLNQVFDTEIRFITN